MQHASGARRIFHKIQNYSPCRRGAPSPSHILFSVNKNPPMPNRTYICIFGMQQQNRRDTLCCVRYENDGILTTMCTIGINKNRDRAQTIQPHELRYQCRGDNCRRFLFGVRAPFAWVCVRHCASKRLQFIMLLMKMSRSTGVLLLGAVYYYYCWILLNEWCRGVAAWRLSLQTVETIEYCAQRLRLTLAVRVYAAAATNVAIWCQDHDCRLETRFRLSVTCAWSKFIIRVLVIFHDFSNAFSGWSKIANCLAIRRTHHFIHYIFEISYCICSFNDDKMKWRCELRPISLKFIYFHPFYLFHVCPRTHVRARNSPSSLIQCRF